MSGFGVAFGLTEEDIDEQIAVAFDDPLLQPWVVDSATVISYGGAIIDSDPGFDCAWRFQNDTGADFCITQVGDNGSAFLRLEKATGAIDSETPAAAGQFIGALSFAGYDGAIYDNNALIVGISAETHSAVAKGTRLEFSVTEIGTDAFFTSVVFEDNGDVTFTDYTDARDDGFTDKAIHGADAQGTLDQSRILVPGQVVAFTGPEDDLNDTTTFEEVLELSMPGDLPAGRYQMEARALVSIDATGGDYESRLLLQGAAQGPSFRREGKDAAGIGLGVDGDNSGTDQRVSMLLSVIRNQSANSTDTLTYEHRSSTNGVEATCFELVLIIRYMGP